jgi:hypothetical protein
MELAFDQPVTIQAHESVAGAVIEVDPSACVHQVIARMPTARRTVNAGSKRSVDRG